MPRNIRLFFFAFALVGLGVFSQTLTTIAQNSTKGKQEQSEPLPKGKWSVMTLFDNKQYYDPSVPIQLTRGTSALGEGYNSGLIELIIKNRTSKNITALKIRYYLTTREDHETVLFQGPPLDIVSRRAKERPTLPANQKRTFEVKDGKFTKLLKPLVKDGALNGEFALVLKISEVIFEDGASWKEEGNVSYKHKVLIRPPPQTTCPYRVRGYEVDSTGNQTSLFS